MRHLPARQRAVIALRYLEGLGVEETAALLNCSTGRVERRTATALRALRAALPDALPPCVRTVAVRGGPGGRPVPGRRRT
ncbi:ECF-type sigma factor [Streptomyces sp. NBC_00510]